MFLKKIYKTLFVDLGFLQSIDAHISNESFYEQITRSRKFIIKKFPTHGLSYESFFIWHLYHNRLHNDLLVLYLEKKYVSIWFYYLIKLSQLFLFILNIPFTIFIIFFLRINFPSIAKFKTKKIVVYTKDKPRENFFKFFSNSYFDMYSIFKYQKYRFAINFNFNDIYHLLKFKFQNKSISSILLLKVYYFKKYLEIFLNSNKAKSKILIREGMTPITKMIYEVGFANNIESRIYLNTLIYNKYSFFPVPSVLLQHKNSDYHNLLIHSDKKIINDNPNINWKSYIGLKKNKFKIGIILGDFYNRYSLQNEVDRDLFNSIKKFTNYEFILRPHPQELSDKSRKNYYKMLINDSKNIAIDSTSDTNYFISNCNIVIATCTSTLIEECCHSGIIILRYKYSKDIDICDDFFKITNFLNFIVNSNNLTATLNNLIKRKNIALKRFFSGKSLSKL